MVQQEFDLNLIPSSEPVVIHINQFDEGKDRFLIHLYNGSSPYVTTNATAKIQGTKPDDKAFQYYCSVDGSTVIADVNPQMTAVDGRVPTQIIITESTGITGTFKFVMDVQKSALEPIIDVSETDLPIYIEEAQEAAERAVDAADRAEAWSAHPPYIGDNKNWYVFDIVSQEFVDTGIYAEGYDGTTTYRGTAVSGKSTTPSVYPTGITRAIPNDTYWNVVEGAMYHCVSGGDATTATWTYDFTISGGGGGGVSVLTDLLDVDISSPSEGQILQYENGEWKNKQGGNGHVIRPYPDSDLTDEDVVEAVNGATGTSIEIASLFGIQRWSNSKTVRVVVTQGIGHYGIGEWQDSITVESATAAQEAQWGWIYHDIFKTLDPDWGEQNGYDVDIKFGFDPKTKEPITLGGYWVDTTTGYLCIKFANYVVNTTDAKVTIDVTFTRNDVVTIP